MWCKMSQEDFFPGHYIEKLGEPSTEIESVLLWSPHNNIPDETLDEYINTARDQHGYDMAQALGLLLQNGYDVEEAMADMPNYVPYKKPWEEHEKKLFEEGYERYGKEFRQIQQMLPEKTIHEVIEYYYKWKKTRPDRKKRAASDFMDNKPNKRPKNNTKDKDEKQPEGSKAPQKKQPRRRPVKKTKKTSVGKTAQEEKDQP